MKPLALVLLLVSTPSVRADESAAPPAAAPEAAPAPELLALEKVLKQKQEAKSKGEIDPVQYKEFVAKFRGDLQDVMERVPKTPENKGLVAIIASRLDEEGRGRALHGLDLALKDDPKNPTLLLAKAQIYYEKKDYAAAEAAARQAGATATSMLRLTEGRTAGVGGAPSMPSMTIRNPEFTADADKPYVLAVPGSAKIFAVPAVGVPGTNQPTFGGQLMVSNATSLWGRASDGLVTRGTDWLNSADTSGENGLSGVGKFGSKAVGKGLVAAGGLMDALPGAAGWVADKQFRVMTGDATALVEVSEKAYELGKTAVLGFSEDVQVAATDWADLVTFKKPTVYQALKATAHTEAILANFLPVGLAARGSKVGAATVEVAGAAASRRALAGRIAVGGREIGEEAAERAALSAACPPGSACGLASRRKFIPADAGGPIRRLTTENIKVTNRGIEAVEKHIARFGKDAPNEVMIGRLRAIAEGKLAPTPQDLDFYAHELREYSRFQKLGVPTGQKGSWKQWNDAHTATLEEYGIKNVDRDLYHPEAGLSD